MACDAAKCTCVQESFGKSLSEWLDLDKCTATNLRDGDTIQSILEEKVTKIECRKEFTVLKIAFVCKVKLTSIILKSTFSDIRIFYDKVNNRNWKDAVGYEEYNVNSTCVLDIFVKNKKSSNLENLFLVLSGDVNSQIEKLKFVGTFLSRKNQPIITTYEAYSTDTMIKKEEVYYTH